MMKHILTSVNDSTPTLSLESPKIITNLKENNMDFSNDSFKKNLTKIANKADISL